MAKSLETIPNKPSVFEKVKEAYNTADQVVVKATTFDGKKAIKRLQGAAAGVLLLNGVGLFQGVESASAMRISSDKNLTPVERVVESVKGGGVEAAFKAGHIDKNTGKFDAQALRKIAEKNTMTSIKGGKPSKIETDNLVKIYENKNAQGDLLNYLTEQFGDSSAIKTDRLQKAVESGITILGEAKETVITPVQKPSITPSSAPSTSPLKPSPPSAEPNIPNPGVNDTEPLRFLSPISTTIAQIKPIEWNGAKQKEFITTQKQVGSKKIETVAPKTVEFPQIKNAIAEAIKESQSKKEQYSSTSLFETILRTHSNGVAFKPDQIKQLKTLNSEPVKRLRRLIVEESVNKGPYGSKVDNTIPKNFALREIVKNIDNTVREVKIKEDENRGENEKNLALGVLGGLLVGGSVASLGAFAFARKNGQKLKILQRENSKLRNDLESESKNNVTLDSLLAQADKNLESYQLINNNLVEENSSLEDALNESDKYSTLLSNEKYSLIFQNNELAKGLSDIRLIEKVLRENLAEKDRKIESLEAQLAGFSETLELLRQEIAELKISKVTKSQPNLFQSVKNTLSRLVSKNMGKSEQDSPSILQSPQETEIAPPTPEIPGSLPVPESIAQLEPGINPIPTIKGESQPTETSKDEITLKVNGVIDSLFNTIVNSAERLRNESKVYNISTIQTQIRLNIGKLNIISTNFDLDQASSVAFNELMAGLIGCGEYEYIANNTKLAPTKKPKPKTPAAQSATQQQVPLVYPDLDSVSRTSDGHRNIAINSPTSIQAFNTGIGGFMPDRVSVITPQIPEPAIPQQPLIPRQPDSAPPSIKTPDVAPIVKTPEQIQIETVFADKIFNGLSQKVKENVVKFLNSIDKSTLKSEDDIFYEIRSDDSINDQQKLALSKAYFSQL